MSRTDQAAAEIPQPPSQTCLRISGSRRSVRIPVLITGSTRAELWNGFRHAPALPCPRRGHRRRGRPLRTVRRVYLRNGYLRRIAQAAPALLDGGTKAGVEFLTALYTSRPARASAEQQTAIDRLQREMANLAVANPDDGFRARDHDRVLYGERR